DEPDPEPPRVGRRAELDRTPVEEDLAFVGPHVAVEDLDERRLAGAVLAEQRVHARRELEVGVVDGEHRPEALHDPARGERRDPPLDAWRCGERRHPSFSSSASRSASSSRGGVHSTWTTGTSCAATLSANSRTPTLTTTG